MSAVRMPPPLPVAEAAVRPGATREQLRDAVAAATPADGTLFSWPRLMEHLMRIGRTDASLGKLAEGHLDALRIHHEAGTSPVPGAVYGVWASRSRGSGLSLAGDESTPRLSGRLRFASGAGVVDRALVPVWPSEDVHVLLDVEVGDWPFDHSAWATSAMRDSHTGSAVLEDRPVVATQLGGEGFYLGRAGFFPGGVGVAGVWVGGAARVLDLVEQALPPQKRSAGQQIRLGTMAADLAGAAAVCRDWARTTSAEDPEPRTAATLARLGVAQAARRLLGEARVVAGAVGLATNPALVRAVDDLTLYLAQVDADQDATWLADR